MIKFLHASDIHLGNYQFLNPTRRDDMFRSFEYILNLAIEQHVNFIMLEGDVFDSLDILPNSMLKVIEILEKFQIKTKHQIAIITIEGNHDRKKHAYGFQIGRTQSWLSVLAHMNLIVLLDYDVITSQTSGFTPWNAELKQGGYVSFQNVRVFGVRYFSNRLGDPFLQISQALSPFLDSFNILLMHFGIKGQMKGVPGIELPRVNCLHPRISYLALGHYHLQFRIGNWIFNPGSSDINSAIESTFERGVFLGTVNEQNQLESIVTIKIPNRKYRWVTINLGPSMKHKADFENLIFQALQKEFPMRTTQSSESLDIPAVYLKIIGVNRFFQTEIDLDPLKERILLSFLIAHLQIVVKLEQTVLPLDSFMAMDSD